MAGNVGAAERYEYTVIGDPVNDAARLTDLAKDVPLMVLARGDLLAAAGEEGAAWEQLEPVVVPRPLRADPDRHSGVGSLSTSVPGTGQQTATAVPWRHGQAPDGRTSPPAARVRLL